VVVFIPNYFTTMRTSLFLFLLIFFSCSSDEQKNRNVNACIDVSNSHPSYWSYNGENILLLGGSDEDNLFQVPDLDEQLEKLSSVGGNYVRNTMSSRDEGNVWPFAKTENGKYDLSIWNVEYWKRFSDFLEKTAERDIFVQVEIWATFDFYRNNWELNPYNPVNNVNYSLRKSKLSDTVKTHPIFTENNFFRSVPAQMALPDVLWYQKQYVDKLLSYTLDYSHILYCMDNETSVTSDWGKFWAKYIQKKAKEAGKTVHTTEMWDPHDLSHPFHAETFDNPEIFTFVDISQNNHKSSDEHWNNGITQLRRLETIGAIRPANNVKIYGNDGGKHKTTRDAIENFVQNVLMGCASARFHRPTSGQGINELAMAVISSMRQLTDTMIFFEGRAANDLLTGREDGEAYCRAIDNVEYAIYFPEGGEVSLDLSGFRGDPSLIWLNVLESTWSEKQALENGAVELKAPGNEHWIGLIQ
jgi:hypothetical protein